ncbi:MAG: SPOR domain-containing protein [Spirochaetota bacterium]
MVSVVLKTIVIIVLFTTVAVAGEQSDFEAIQKAFRLNSSNKQELVKKFFKTYPNSNYIPHIRMLIAGSASTVDGSIAEYYKIISNYRYFEKRDVAFLSLCQLYYIKSDWGNLLAICNQAIAECSTSNYRPIFLQLRAIAHYNHNHYDDGVNDCEKIPEYSRQLNTLAYSLFLKSEMDRQMYGYARQYIKGLAELLHGYSDAAIYPTCLLQLGQYYEYNKMYNEAWSTYNFLMVQFPKSPEAVKAYIYAQNVKKFNPTTVAFMPDEKIIALSDTIDIKPELEEKETLQKPSVYYTITIGPFYNLQKAKELQKLIVTYVLPVHIVRKNKSFDIYAGHFTSLDEGMSIKIQLAEELGINGFIIEIFEQDEKQYIYGQ